jgi:hypothetical protein
MVMAIHDWLHRWSQHGHNTASVLNALKSKVDAAAARVDKKQDKKDQKKEKSESSSSIKPS